MTGADLPSRQFGVVVNVAALISLLLCCGQSGIGFLLGTLGASAPLSADIRAGAADVRPSTTAPATG